MEFLNEEVRVLSLGLSTVGDATWQIFLLMFFPFNLRLSSQQQRKADEEMSTHIVIVCMFLVDWVNWMFWTCSKCYIWNITLSVIWNTVNLACFPSQRHFPVCFAFVKMLFQNYWNRCQQQTKPEATSECFVSLIFLFFELKLQLSHVCLFLVGIQIMLCLTALRYNVI